MEFKSSEDPNSILIMITGCIPDLLEPGEVCELSSTEINSKLLSIKTQIKLSINLSQYNSQTKQFEAKKRIEDFMFDQTLAFYSYIKLIKTDLSIVDGFILQSTETTPIISEYKR